MNVLIVYPHGNALNACSGGDMRVWVQNYCLVKNNFNVSILHSLNSKGSEDEQLKKKCNVYYYKDLKIFGASDWYFTDLNPFFALKLRQVIRKQKIDIIQIEWPWGFLITKLLSKKNICLIFNSHGVESEFMRMAIKHPSFPKMLKPFAGIFARLYEKLVCKLTDIIINVSEVDRNYYIKNYKIKRSKTIIIQTPSSINIQNPLTIENLKPESRRKLGLPRNKTIVIFHGALPHPPNQEAFNLIENYIAPRIKNRDILFVLAGNNLKKFRRDNIISLGFVQDIKDLIFSADFAIVPIISGSGMRVKCADYITAALPFVITRKGIEGIDFLKAGVDYLEYSEVNHDFIGGIHLLHEDKELRQKMRLNLLKKSSTLNIESFEHRYLKLFSKLKTQ